MATLAHFISPRDMRRLLGAGTSKEAERHHCNVISVNGPRESQNRRTTARMSVSPWMQREQSELMQTIRPTTSEKVTRKATEKVIETARKDGDCPHEEEHTVSTSSNQPSGSSQAKPLLVYQRRKTRPTRQESPTEIRKSPQETCYNVRISRDITEEIEMSEEAPRTTREERALEFDVSVEQGPILAPLNLTAIELEFSESQTDSENPEVQVIAYGQNNESIPDLEPQIILEMFRVVERGLHEAINEWEEDLSDDDMGESLETAERWLREAINELGGDSSDYDMEEGWEVAGSGSEEGGDTPEYSPSSNNPEED